MSLLSEQKFRFVSMAEPGNTFSVVRFNGREGLNTLFEFEIELVSERDDIDLTDVLESPATFTILRQDRDVPFSGILKHFEQKQKTDKAVFYHAVLAPKLWWLTLTYHNQVFLKKTTPQMLEEVLQDGGLLASDYEFKLQKSYPEWEYVCQYNETHYTFFLRWLERDGLYYYFDHSGNKSVLVVTDTYISHEAMPQGSKARYAPPSGLEQPHMQEVVRSFVLRQQMVPKTVKLKDYNYRTPALSLQANAEVADYGRGTFYHYGEHFFTPSEAENLARVRAEGHKCREKRYHGQSSVPFLRPGFTFSLEDHYRSDFNQDYLAIEIEHRGSQAAYFVAGLGLEEDKAQDVLHYENSFVAIPASVQFRGLLQTEKPRIAGTMNAWVDASGSGMYAQVDDQGRYKIKLPFDLSGRQDGEASAWVRMAQPYGGNNHGLHFPLHKGTEVLLTFIDGDPDRPIIQSTVPNPERPSVITQDDQTMCKITTSGQNKIHIEDKEGSQRILMHSPTRNSFVRIGAHNDPPTAANNNDDSSDKPKDGISLVTENHLSIQAASKNSIILGENSSTIIGMDFKWVGGERMDITMLHRTNLHLGWLTDIKIGGHWTYTPVWKDMRAASSKEAGESNEMVLERNEEVGEHDEVVGEQSEVHGERNVVNGELDLVVGERSGVFGESNDVYGESTILAGELNFVCGELTTTIGEHTNLVGELTTMAGEVTTMAGEITEMTGEKSILAGELSILAGMITLL